jgi:ribonuclease P protein component
MVGHAHRFHGRSSLRYVLTRGQTVRAQLIALRYVRNDRQQSYRAAVVVSRKVSKSAVVRNRIRRRIFEIVRKNSKHIAGPYDLVFSVYGEDVAKMRHAALQTTVLEQLQKARVISGAGHATIDTKEENKE